MLRGRHSILRGWLETARITDGPLFRLVDRPGKIGPGRLSAAGANRLVQRAVARAGADPRPYSAHSLRAGLATAAAEAAGAERAIMNLRHPAVPVSAASSWRAPS